MNAPQPPTTPRRWRVVWSFLFAWRGVVILLRTQTNARIHLVATLLVVTAGFLFKLSREEWTPVVAVIGLVWTAEGLNTAIETVVDLVSPEYHVLAGRAKDLAAGAVLCAATAAAIVGASIFWPHVAALL